MEQTINITITNSEFEETYFSDSGMIALAQMRAFKLDNPNYAIKGSVDEINQNESGDWDYAITITYE